MVWQFHRYHWSHDALSLLASGALELEEVPEGDAAAGLITVAERPTRLICAALGALCAAIAPSAMWTASVCAAVWGAAALIALAQLGARARRQRL